MILIPTSPLQNFHAGDDNNKADSTKVAEAEAKKLADTKKAAEKMVEAKVVKK